MRFAYIISAYKLPNQLIRLVNKLQSTNSIFFIHVDKKTSRDIFLKMKNGLNYYSNVYFLKRHNCYWGDFGHVSASLKGIKEIANLNISFDYVILLTGQDYPIKSKKYIENFFIENNGYSFMSYTVLPHKTWHVMDRIEYWHFFFWGKYLRFPTRVKRGKFALYKKIINKFIPKKRCFMPNMTPYAGCSYWNLSKEAVCYISDYIDNNPNFIRFFKNTIISDELFFQTLLLNSSLKNKIINEDLRFIDWTQKGKHPATLNKSFFNVLQSSKKLFARKFDQSIDDNILNLIDADLLDENKEHIDI